jgi:hypothetical protein
MRKQLEIYIQARLSSTSEYWPASQQQYTTLGPLKHVLMEQIRARTQMEELLKAVSDLKDGHVTMPKSPEARLQKHMQPDPTKDGTRPSACLRELAAEMHAIRGLLQKLVADAPQCKSKAFQTDVAVSCAKSSGSRPSVLFTRLEQQMKETTAAATGSRPTAISTGTPCALNNYIGIFEPATMKGVRLPSPRILRTGVGVDRQVSPDILAQQSPRKSRILRKGLGDKLLPDLSPPGASRAAAVLNSGQRFSSVQTMPRTQRRAAVQARDPARSLLTGGKGGRRLYSSVSSDLVLERSPFASSRLRMVLESQSSAARPPIWC